jgi:protein-S-isoprenylcysteine O-methyltransferase Ste14
MADTPTPVATVTVTKPELKQVSNYVGAAALGVAGFLVAHQDLIATITPPPWNAVATGVLSVIGAALIAYREKHTIPTPTTGVQ